MLRIELSRGKHAIIDDCDIALIKEFNWCWKPSQSRFSGGYAYTNINRQMTYMHRLILHAGPDDEIDHLNKDGCDNRRQNLRICTRSQNNANRRTTPNASGFRGVYPNGSSVRPYTAKIQVNGIDYRAGRFSDPELAARAYDALALRHFGPFASLNFPSDEAPNA